MQEKEYKPCDMKVKQQTESPSLVCCTNTFLLLRRPRCLQLSKQAEAVEQLLSGAERRGQTSREQKQAESVRHAHWGFNEPGYGKTIWCEGRLARVDVDQKHRAASCSKKNVTFEV